jgi:O-antigen ligase
MSTPNESPPARRLPVVALVVLAAAVVFGAFLFGAPPRQSVPSAAEPLRAFLESLGALAGVEAATAVALGLLLVTGCIRREAPVLPGERDAARARRPLVLLLALGLLQLVPLPRGVLGFVAPFSAETYEALLPARAGEVRPAARVGAVALGFVVVLGFAESAYGLLETRLGGDAILGFEKVSNKGSVTGTFIHRTMLAVWAEMALCAATGLAVGVLVGGNRHGRGFKVGTAAALAACGAVCAAAAVLSRARLGHVALAAGVVALVVLLAPVVRRTAGRAWSLALVAALAVAGAGAGLMAWRSEAIRERFGHFVRGDSLHDPRFTAWESTLELFREAPVLGTGIGSFGRAIHLTQSIDNPEELWFAHSDPLNLLSDAGVVGFVLGAAWLLGLVRRGLAGVRHEDARIASVSGACLAAAVVVLTASLGDFQTQFPVVAIPFAALLTLPAALARVGRAAESERRVRPWLLPPRGLAAVAAGILGVTALVPIAGAARRATLRNPELPAAPTEAERLMLEGRARLLSARAAPEERRTALLEEAEDLLRAAAVRDPLLDEAHLWLAHASLLLEHDREDVLRSLGRARRVSRGHAEVNAQVGSTYLALLGTEPAPFGPPGDSALAALREAGALKEGLFSRAWTLTAALPIDERMQVVPDRSHALITLGEHFQLEGDLERALEAFRRAVELDPLNPATVHRAAAVFRRLGREAEGRAFVEAAGGAWPASE